MVSIVTSFALDKAIISGEAENGKRKRHRKEGEDERKRVRQKNRRDEPKDSPSRLDYMFKFHRKRSRNNSDAWSLWIFARVKVIKNLVTKALERLLPEP